jgi:hypothetical protein
MSDAAPESARRPSFARLSLWIAVVVAVATMAVIAGSLAVAQMGPEQVRNVGILVLIVFMSFVAPIGHIAGILLGVAALFRAGDRRGLAALGVLLNLAGVIFDLFLF